MLKKLETISSETKFENPYWEYKFDKYKTPNGKTAEYHYVSTNGSTMIAPLDSDGKYIMTIQYRYLNQKESLEFPGGGVKRGLSPEENAAEELKEETGVSAGKLTKIGECNPFNGVTDEICGVFLAENLTFAKPEPDETEQFEILRLSAREIREKIRSGELWDGMTLAAWAMVEIAVEDR